MNLLQRKLAEARKNGRASLPTYCADRQDIERLLKDYPDVRLTVSYRHYTIRTL